VQPHGGRTEFYLDAQTTFHDSTVATGFRWENRFRPLKREYFINPVLYVGVRARPTAQIKILKELEGHDTENGIFHAECGSA